MVRAEARYAWHLMRGRKIYGPISHREFRLLAELGHLRPEDLLWRPGLGSWTSASSVPGFHFLLPPVRSQIGQGALTRISALFFAAKKFWLWGDRLTLSANQLVRSVKGRLQHAYHWILSRWPNSNLIEFLHHRRRQGIVVGLLVMAVFIGAMDVAMKASFATSNKSQKASSVAQKRQDRLSTALVAPRPLWTANSSEFKPAVDLTKAEVFNVSNGHPTGGFVVASNAPTEPIAQPHTEPNLTPLLQSEAAAASDEVPLPTKKPDKPLVKAQPNMVIPKRTAQRPIGREPKPMRFGTIGYNYSPQQ